MRTPKQIEAARLNGAKSRGPKTPGGKSISAANTAHSTGPTTAHGKANSSRNATRHGLLAASIVLPTEAQAGFRELLDDLHQELQPATPIECRLVEVMAVLDWRRMRVWCLQMGQIAHALFAQQRIADPIIETEAGQIPVMPTAIAFGSVSSNGSGTLNPLHRYESWYSREYRRTLRDFKAHRAERLTQQSESPKRTEPENAQPTPHERDPQ
jgi:hypothetical protein